MRDSGYQYETSFPAYEEVLSENLGKKQQAVMDVIVDSRIGLTNKEIAEKLGWPINTVTPRTNELVKMGWVEADGKRQINGRMAIVWNEVKE